MDGLLHDFDDLELQHGSDALGQDDDWPSSNDTDARAERRERGRAAGEEEKEGRSVGERGAGSGAGASPPDSPRGSEPGDLTCAICLHNIELENLAMVKGCDHMYCATCILHWALHKEEPWCPQCKQPFSYLLTYRTLDGTLQDFPSEESVTLLKRARWLEDHVRASDKGKALLDESRASEEHAWQEYADDFELAEDEEIEAFYFSSAAGRARVVLENRRFGAGGYVAAGRRHARPVPPHRRVGAKAAKSGEHAVVGTPPVARSGAQSFHTPNANAEAFGTSPSGSGPVFASSPSGSGAIYGSSPSGSGRRARRNAKRQAMDTAMQQLGFAP